MKQVRTGLYVGTRKDAENFTVLKENAISRVLTVDNQALEGNHIAAINTLYIHCLDEITADLLTSFDKCIEFINEALANNESVLVHW